MLVSSPRASADVDARGNNGARHRYSFPIQMTPNPVVNSDAPQAPHRLPLQSKEDQASCNTVGLP